MSTIATTTQPNSDEKLWAAVAHGSALFFFFGPILPTIVWATQRKKSAYATFHGLQALAYQTLFFWTWMVLGVVLGVVISAVVAAGVVAFADSLSDSMPALIIVLEFALLGGMFGAFALFVLVGLIGAVYSLLGREFRYPLLGRRLARFLEYQPGTSPALNEPAEERLAASCSHASAVIVLWGVIIPLITWLTQKDRSAFLRFHSLQALVFQGIGLVVYFGVMALYMILIFGTLALGFVVADGSAELPGAAPVVAVLIPAVCMMFVFYVLGPIYVILASVASLRVLRGRDYRYPLVGALIQRRLKSSG